MGFAKEYFEKVDFENQQTTKKPTNYPVEKKLSCKRNRRSLSVVKCLIRRVARGTVSCHLARHFILFLVLVQPMKHPYMTDKLHRLKQSINSNKLETIAKYCINSRITLSYVSFELSPCVYFTKTALAEFDWSLTTLRLFNFTRN